MALKSHAAPFIHHRPIAKYYFISDKGWHPVKSWIIRTQSWSDRYNDCLFGPDGLRTEIEFIKH